MLFRNLWGPIAAMLCVPQVVSGLHLINFILSDNVYAVWSMAWLTTDCVLILAVIPVDGQHSGRPSQFLFPILGEAARPSRQSWTGVPARFSGVQQRPLADPERVGEPQCTHPNLGRPLSCLPSRHDKNSKSWWRTTAAGFCHSWGDLSDLLYGTVILHCESIAPVYPVFT